MRILGYIKEKNKFVWAGNSHSRRIRNFLLFLCGIQFFLPVLFTGPVITYDSQGYLSSAKAILTDQFRDYYIFFRSPGYPLFLKLTLGVSEGSFRFVIVVQAALVSISTFLLLSQIHRVLLKSDPRKNRAFMIISSLCTIQIGIIGYSAAALQQAVFVALTNFTLALGLYCHSNSIKKLLPFWSLLTLISYSISPVITIVPILTFFLSKNASSILALQTVRGKTVAIFQIALLVLPTALFAIGWNAISADVGSKNPSASMGSTIGFAQLAKVPNWLASSPISAADSLMKSFVAQSGIIPSSGWHGVISVDNSPFFENRTHSEQAFLVDRRTGLYDAINNSSWVVFAKDSYYLDSAPLSLPNTFVFILSFMTYLIKVLWLSVPLFILLLLALPRDLKGLDRNLYRLMSIPVFAFAMLYVLLGAEADRYALPAFMPVSLAMLIFFYQVFSTQGNNSSNLRRK